MNTESQCKKILAYIKRYGSITRMDSIRRCRCVNLPGRVWDINRRARKTVIKGVMEKSRNGVWFKRYSLA